MKETYYIDINGVWRIEEFNTTPKQKQFTYELNCCVKGMILKNLINYDKEIFDLVLKEMKRI